MIDAQAIAFAEAVAIIKAACPVRLAGPGAALARVANVSRAAGNAAFARDRRGKGVRCPRTWVLAVEEASGVSRHRLRPDLYPVLDQPAAVVGESGVL